MDYQDFLSKSTAKVSNMSQEEMQTALLNLLRMTMPENREKVLQMLDPAQDSFQKDVTDYANWFKEMAKKKYHFLREEDDYYDYDDEWDFSDSDDYQDIYQMGEMLRKIFDLAEQLIYTSHYREAAELYARCCTFSYRLHDEVTGEESELSFDDVMSELMEEVECKKIAMNLLYTAIQMSSSTEHLEELYRYYSFDMCYSITLEEIISTGPKPIERLEQFLAEWIQFLSKVEGSLADRLLMDAIAHSPALADERALHQLARETANLHPTVYLKYIEQLVGEKEWQKVLTIGVEALEAIPRANKVRSTIARKLIKIAERLNNSAVSYEARLAAYYSDPQLVNLFPVITEPLQEEDRLALLEFTQTDETVEERQQLLFFLQQFGQVYELEQQERQKVEIGWNSYSTGEIVPLYLLLLRKGPFSKAATQVIASRLSMDLVCFEDYFEEWKTSVTLPEEEQEIYLNWCQLEVEKVTDVLIDSKYRKYYMQMAALIVLLGEAMEGSGILNACQELIQAYRQQHKQKRNFIQELAVFADE
ncbi:hypothetical protein BAU15_01655 [Enterococcus sp. JM4C]|uniref:hypothetical protein n=1 Tax=Candidatus Enterococcus huntleyi TaxID=1857217 RepID=UPI00137976C0|nr:hypothetical protein [Enterococcus sp. JM4C]KAF1299378.1 hypothetical protein BAU15_01655 [Enterococcus sp. JM4C]